MSPLYFSRNLFPSHDQVVEKTGLKPYERYDGNTGEIIKVNPEYATMSRNPAIGKRFLEKYKGDIYPKDYVTVNGKKMKPAKYYDRWMQENHSFEIEEIKDRRQDVDREYITVRREQQKDEFNEICAKRFQRDQKTK